MVLVTSLGKLAFSPKRLTNAHNLATKIMTAGNSLSEIG